MRSPEGKQKEVATYHVYFSQLCHDHFPISANHPLQIHFFIYSCAYSHAFEDDKVPASTSDFTKATTARIAITAILSLSPESGSNEHTVRDLGVALCGTRPIQATKSSSNIPPGEGMSLTYHKTHQAHLGQDALDLDYKSPTLNVSSSQQRNPPSARFHPIWRSYLPQ